MEVYVNEKIYRKRRIRGNCNRKYTVFKRNEVMVKRTRITDVASEKERLVHAKEMSIAQLREIYEKALKEVGETNAQIFEIHMMLIEDEDYNESIDNIIENQMVSGSSCLR